MINIEKEIIRDINQRIDSQQKKGQKVTREDIPSIFDAIIKKQLFDPTPYSEEDYKKIAIDKIRICSIIASSTPTSVGKISIIEKKSSDHIQWVPKQKQDAWHFTERFKEYLMQDINFNPDTINSLCETSSKILSRLENPNRPGKWGRKGLIFGDVQSGKTSSYSALINQAADTGYKIIIILGGLNNNLRSQTQIAIEENFRGYRTNTVNNPSVDAVGVGKITQYQLQKPEIHTTRDINGDFKKNVMNSKKNNDYDAKNINLYVIKKNVSPLNFLFDLLQSKINEVEDLPVLLIDDESDHGSINTKKPEYNPTAINTKIRLILDIFNRTSYVAYTATPFANIFISKKEQEFTVKFKGNKVAIDAEGNELTEVKNGKLIKKIEEKTRSVKDHNLFPEHFIINLPSNSNYIGGKKLFNIPDNLDESEDRHPLPVVLTSEKILDYDEDKLKLEEEWIPQKHNKDYIFKYDGNENDISPTLKYAIKCFILSIAARNLRMGNNQHHTMLINITNWNDTNTQIVKLVDTELNDYILPGLKGNFPNIINTFKDIWINDFCKTTKEINHMMSKNEIDIGTNTVFKISEWEEIKEQLYSKRIQKIEVQKIFGDNKKDVLRYKEYEDGNDYLSVIAIGAIKLSRGLVLKNLTTSYFKRSSKQYDTLLQMGRWFGYRNNYLDLCRLIITDDLKDKFEKACWATEKLKKDFSEMGNAEPSDWGLKVRTFPEIANLVPTSANKMRSSEKMNMSFAGDKKVTTAFKIDKKSLNTNIDSIRRLISNMSDRQDLIKKDNLQIWESIPTDMIIDFLNSYSAPSMKYESNANKNNLIEFIKKCNETNKSTIDIPKLSSFDVFIKGSEGVEMYEYENLKIPMVNRSPFTGRQINVLKEGLHYKRVMQDEKKTKVEYLEKGFNNEKNEKFKKYTYVGNVGDKDTIKIINDKKIIDRAKIKTIKEWNGKGKQPSEASEKFLRHEMPIQKGIIGFYLFDIRQSKHNILNNFYKDVDKPIVGYTISFPKNLNVSMEYFLNEQAQREGLDIDGEEEDELF